MLSMQMRRLRDVSIFHRCRIDIISDPSDMYVFAKDDNFILREDLEK